MRVTRIYADSDGESHFEDVDVAAEIGTSGGSNRSLIVPPVPALTLNLRDVLDESDSFEFHNAPHRQFVFHLRGSADIEVSDGELRTIGPGDILFVEDITGRGHRLRGRGPDRRTAIVPVPESFTLR